MDDSGYYLMQLVPFLLLSVPFAIGNGYLAARLGRNRVVWVILSLLPLVNYLFYVYVAYQIVFFVIDQLTGIPKKIEA
jgi:MFS-type transporter involved in bile tolerance (Atg22 family)